MTWLWQIAAKKAVVAVVQGAIAILSSGAVASALNNAGVSVTVDPTVASAATFGALEFLRNWIKVKTGVKFL